MTTTPKTSYRERSKNREPAKIERIKIGRREAVNLAGANELLNQRAQEKYGDGRRYYVDRAYSLYKRGDIEGVKISRRIFYFVDSLMKYPLPAQYHPHGGNTHTTQYANRYPDPVRERALVLVKEGKTQKEAAETVAKEFELPTVPKQAVYYWANQEKKKEQPVKHYPARSKRSRERTRAS